MPGQSRDKLVQELGVAMQDALRTSAVIRETHEATIRIETKCGQCQETLTALQSTVYGKDGSNGLVAQVAVLKRLVGIGSGLVIAAFTALVSLFVKK